MSLISWTPNLSVNVPAIDEQHKRLVQMINDLHDAMGKGKGKEVLSPLLSKLIDYTVVHFQSEEAFMRKCGFPGVAQHQLLHQELTEKVKKLKARFETGELLITMDTMNFLKDWLKTHILGSDKQYAQFVAQHGAPVGA